MRAGALPPRRRGYDGVRAGAPAQLNQQAAELKLYTTTSSSSPLPPLSHFLTSPPHPASLLSELLEGSYPSSSSSPSFGLHPPHTRPSTFCGLASRWIPPTPPSFAAQRCSEVTASFEYENVYQPPLLRPPPPPRWGVEWFYGHTAVPVLWDHLHWDHL